MAARQQWIIETPTTLPGASQQESTRAIQIAHRHARETQDKALKAVHDLEAKLEITDRWVPGCDDWARTSKLVTM